MRNIIKKILKEQFKSYELTGCDYFDKKSYDYRWCKAVAEKSLMRNTTIAKRAIEKYKKEILSQHNQGLRAQPYDKEHPFFTDRRSQVIDALDKFKKSCPKFYNYIVERMKHYTTQYVILNSENQYDLLNKLNTNWSALSLLLTLALPEEYKDLKKFTFSEAQRFFFQTLNEDGISPFEKFMGDWESEQKENVRNKIYSTIQSKSREGQDIEDNFYEFISKYVNAIQFSGDYSFMDMIGADMIIETPEGDWIPVQVKKYSGACLASSSDDSRLRYRDYMCENWCVSNEDEMWRIRTFKGPHLQKNKNQCKTKPLNMTCFLNIHTHETDHEADSCVQEKSNDLNQINF